ncbi:LAGLIDADG family homing endonuclease [Bacillus shivajii]|uniref:LAGLIDADG family homing endonuclease n=1 Tax=Bacillus shivajii TaxID=1983719 RepID=UPI001CFB8A7A|nr:LAGLIDADG family homing endonuclease [Bacillus shivajii]UCZ52613.1 LAGLIDADG family homing endonuclease [Bacillus shivajii]
MKELEAAYLAGIIDGEGSITLTRNHTGERRRPLISIASTDIELLEYIKSIAGGSISSKKNDSPNSHKDSYTLTIKKKAEVFALLISINPYLRISSKKQRAEFILNNYEKVTVRNGKYSQEALTLKQKFEEDFLKIK